MAPIAQFSAAIGTMTPGFPLAVAEFRPMIYAMVAKGPPIAAQIIMTTPGLLRSVLAKSLSWWFFAHTASDQKPLTVSLRPAARAARTNVMVKADSAALPLPHSPPANHSPHTPCVSARVKKPVYKP